MRLLSACAALLLLLPSLAFAQQKASVAADRVNVRASSSVDAAIVTTLGRGTSVTVLERTDTWTQISVGDKKGYIRTSMLSFSGGAAAASSAPAPAPRRTANAPAERAPAPAPAPEPRRTADAPAGSAFGVGSKLLSVGLTGGGAANYGLGIGAQYEVGFKELSPSLTLGLGATVGYSSRSFDYGTFRGTRYSYNWTTIPVGAIGNVHWKIPSQPKLDLYGGLSLGYAFYSFSSDFDDFDSRSVSGTSDLLLGINVGARYQFAPKFQGMMQLSGGDNLSLYQIGLSFRM
ncbi:SH3 domain-containing protein [Gemmatimonas sp.]|uniref:SH3 domain-containing protein n=1 Tax=Gemmatimonas sp. TaxID=1962908 RepID=UPI003342113E